jgi:hypothetical protein
MDWTPAQRNLIDAHLLVSACARLVTPGSHSQMIWLVHFAVTECLQDCFDDGTFYSYAASYINTTCLRQVLDLKSLGKLII